MRMVQVTPWYEGWPEQFYASHPGLADEPYAVQHATLMRECVFWGDSWVEPMAKRGWEVVPLVPNATPLQRRWLAENGGGSCDSREILLAQIGVLRPDVLLLADWPAHYGREFVARCREKWPGIRLVIGRCGEMCPAVVHLEPFDLTLSCDPSTVDSLRMAGIRADRLDHAFDPRVHERLQAEAGAKAAPTPFGFIGQLGLRIERVRLVAAVARKTDLAIYGFLSQLSPPYRPSGLKGAVRDGYYAGLAGLERCGLERLAARMPQHGLYRETALYRERVALAESLRSRLRPSLFGMAMFRTLAGFDVCLNTHGGTPHASNMRLFEATGVGVCLLTDAKADMARLFEPGVEVVAYRSARDCIEKVRYLLDHPREREAIAAAGQKRTLRDHTFENRADALDSILRGAMP